MIGLRFTFRRRRGNRLAHPGLDPGSLSLLSDVVHAIPAFAGLSGI